MLLCVASSVSSNGVPAGVGMPKDRRGPAASGICTPLNGVGYAALDGQKGLLRAGPSGGRQSRQGEVPVEVRRETRVAVSAFRESLP